MKEFVLFVQLSKQLDEQLANFIFRQCDEWGDDKIILLKYSYFEVDNIYYFFICAPNKETINDTFFKEHLPIQANLIRRKRDVDLKDSNPRRLRSLRGFLLLALTIQAKKKETFKVIKSNLGDFFWEMVEKKLRHNKKGILINFLFNPEKLTRQKVHEFEVLKNLQNKQNLNKKYDELLSEIQQLHSEIKELKKLIKISVIGSNIL